MSEISQKCRAMAAQMLDAELMAILRKINEGDRLTRLQEAVLSEIRKRELVRPASNLDHPHVPKAADATNGVYNGST